jgi:hypothetical protein
VLSRTADAESVVEVVEHVDAALLHVVVEADDDTQLVDLYHVQLVDMCVQLVDEDVHLVESMYTFTHRRC